MVHHERVADNVFFFKSAEYALVTAGVIAGPEWAVVIDTLAYPDETVFMREYIERELGVPVRYVINTHYHADHSWGNCFFPGALIIGHQLCREYLEERGRPSLKLAQKENAIFQPVKIIPPRITFMEGDMILRVGKKSLRMFHLPGHSKDQIGVFIEEHRVLFAGDLCMPVPYIVDGDIEDMIASLKIIGKMSLENIVQGHGDIILRGEVAGMVKGNLAYLSAIRRAVRKASRRKYPLDLLSTVDIESCGISRVLLGGLANELHRRNLVALYRQLFGENPQGFPDILD